MAAVSQVLFQSQRAHVWVSVSPSVLWGDWMILRLCVIFILSIQEMKAQKDTGWQPPWKVEAKDKEFVLTETNFPFSKVSFL